MKKISILFAVTLLFLNTKNLKSNESPSKLKLVDNQVIQKVNAYVENVMNRNNIQGIGYAVLVNGKTIHKKSMGYSNVASLTLVTTKTIFPIASITKLFVSIAVQELLLKSTMDVNEAIGSALSGLPKQWQPLTIKQLLSHTSGLPDISVESLTLESNKQTILNALYDQPFEYKTGEKSQYNQTGFLLLYMLIEKLAGMSLENYLQIHHFDKYNMSNTYYSNAAPAYQITNSGVELSMKRWYIPAIYASAGLNTSLDDMTTWLEVLLAGEILKENKLRQIWKPVSLKSGSYGRFSLGWEASYGSKINMAGHGGADTLEVRHFLHKTTNESVTIVWLSNTKNFLRGDQGYDPNDTVNKLASFFMEDIEQCSAFLKWFRFC